MGQCTCFGEGCSAGRGHLRQREDGDLVLRVVGQVLVQVGQAGRVAAQLVVHHAQLVARRHLPAPGLYVYLEQPGCLLWWPYGSRSWSRHIREAIYQGAQNADGCFPLAVRKLQTE